ncbi:MAG: HAD family hydrolase, partial [Verrucomicrobia bacterium]|nr:HAD family hydrolase [Verrucomicrobiota bacterium]
MDTELIERLRAGSGIMEPEPTGTEPRLPHLSGLRAVCFDVYGTLLISGSGDISLAGTDERSPALAAALEAAGFRLSGGRDSLARRFHACLAEHRDRRRAEGVDFPEVRIEEVWEAFATLLRQDGFLAGEGDVHTAAVEYELRANPCWPMPGLAETLQSLRAAALPMGIVSNAQFYTPLLFNALCGKSPGALGFSEDLMVWSFREREGKPSRRLYEKLAAALLRRGLRPEQTLFIGNDMRNDIAPAAACGFRTALFAGDQRSLRWRKDDPLA